MRQEEFGRASALFSAPPEKQAGANPQAGKSGYGNRRKPSTRYEIKIQSARLEHIKW